jgi:hypothetical protein
VYHKKAKSATAKTKTVSSKKRPIAVDFNGGKLTSDAGAILLREADRKLQLTKRINSSINDPRDPRYIHHRQQDLIAQRIYSIALGYEDVNDQTKLRKDPAMLVAVKDCTDEELPLGSASTLCRLENRITSKEITECTKLFVEYFIESFKEPPKEIILDFDATDDTIHGTQEGRYFNGFYDSYCFLPLYVFCGDQLLWSHLRTSKKGGAFGARAIFHYLVQRIKKAFPKVDIIFRGDAGFYSPELLNYCDRYGYKYILGISSNRVLKRLSQNAVIASKLFFKDGGSQEKVRLYEEYFYQSGKWDYARSIIAKVERLPDGDNVDGKDNTRYVVTNMVGSPQELYEDVYCARGDMENRIKEQQKWLFSDRTSCHYFLANRFRLFMSSAAYVLMETIRRTALCGTSMAKAQCGTIREKLFKIAAVVKVSVRRILISLSSCCPVQELWLRVYDRLRFDRLWENLPEPSD